MFVDGATNAVSFKGDGTNQIINSPVPSKGAWTQYYKDMTPSFVGGIGTYSPQADASVSGLAFSTYSGSWVERMRIHSGGVVSVPVGIELGSGVDATAANTLDDYEEGSFTCTLNASTSNPTTRHTADTAVYTKIGNTVSFQISFENKNTTGYAGDMSFTGLPFTNQGGRCVTSMGLYYGAAWTDSPMGILNNAATAIGAFDFKTAAAWVPIQHNVSSASHFWITGSYITS